VTSLEPTGGAWGLGRISAELDVHDDDWFLTCHFSDDPVMPGTLMYECCLHTLRVLLLGLGFVGEEGEVEAHPVPGVPGRLRCRGQVVPGSRVVGYDVSIREIAFAPEPTVIAEARMLVDGREIVAMQGLSVRLAGFSEERVEQIWRLAPGPGRGQAPVVPDRCLSPPPSYPHPTERGVPHSSLLSDVSGRIGTAAPFAFRAGIAGEGTGTGGVPPEPVPVRMPEPVPVRMPEPVPVRMPEPVPVLIAEALPPRYLYDHASILEFALGKPSAAFGDRYRKFEDGFIARLPAPPYCFIDGISAVEGPPWELRDGTRCVAEYAVPADAWFFDATRRARMPYAVLLEIALQPCGWLAAYCGSALTTDEPLHFRNLGGRATQHRPVTRTSGRLVTEVALTGHSASGGMLIEHFSLSVRDAEGVVYEGTTYFGFFPRAVLANQVGIRDALPAGFPVADRADSPPRRIPEDPRGPDARFRMVDRLDAFDPRGGPAGLGAVRGSIAVDPAAWFFSAHFHQDPVWPGSLGLESFLQLLEIPLAGRFGPPRAGECPALALGVPHEWTYRGQVLGHRQRVTVEAVVRAEDPARRRLVADGRLVVDGLWIYAMKGFALEIASELPGGVL